MRKFYVLLLGLLVSVPLISQNKQIVLWGETRPPGQDAIQKDPVVSENTSRNVLRYAEVTRPVLIVYEPDADKDKGKAMIVCPGGGYQILAYDLEGTEVAEWLQGLGYHVFVLQYRVPKSKKVAIQDAQRALRMVKNYGAAQGYQKWKVGIMGFSAGGHLAARTATFFHQNSYHPRDELDTIDPLPDFAALIYPAYLDDAPGRTLSEDIKIAESTPPMFIFGTEDDSYGNDAIIMAQSLRDHRVPVEFHMYAQGGHGYGLRKGNPSAEAWPALLAIWLTQFD